MKTGLNQVSHCAIQQGANAPGYKGISLGVVTMGRRASFGCQGICLSSLERSWDCWATGKRGVKESQAEQSKDHVHIPGYFDRSTGYPGRRHYASGLRHREQSGVILGAGIDSTDILV